MVISIENAANLNIAVQVMDSLLLPVVLGFLFALGFTAIDEEHRLKGRVQSDSVWHAYDLLNSFRCWCYHITGVIGYL